MKKVAEITREELESSWEFGIFQGKKYAYCGALLGIKKSASLVGGEIQDSVYIPHRWVPEKEIIEVFEADFMLGGLDPNIPIPFYIKNFLAHPEDKEKV